MSQPPLTITERILGALGCVSPFIGIAVVSALFSGCIYRGAKVTEGTDLAIGLNVPVSEGTLQFQVLNYLSGFRLAVDRNAILRCKYTVAETNAYLGVVHTHVVKTMDASVEPCESGSALGDTSPSDEASSVATGPLRPGDAQ